MKEMWTFNKKKSRLLAGFMAFVLVFSNIAANVQTVYATGIATPSNGIMLPSSGQNSDDTAEPDLTQETEPSEGLVLDILPKAEFDEEAGRYVWSGGWDTYKYSDQEGVTLGQVLLQDSEYSALAEELTGTWSSDNTDVLAMYNDGDALVKSIGRATVTFTYEAPMAEPQAVTDEAAETPADTAATETEQPEDGAAVEGEAIVDEAEQSGDEADAEDEAIVDEAEQSGDEADTEGEAIVDEAEQSGDEADAEDEAIVDEAEQSGDEADTEGEAIVDEVQPANEENAGDETGDSDEETVGEATPQNADKAEEPSVDAAEDTTPSETETAPQTTETPADEQNASEPEENDEPAAAEDAENEYPMEDRTELSWLVRVESSRVTVYSDEPYNDVMQLAVEAGYEWPDFGSAHLEEMPLDPPYGVNVTLPADGVWKSLDEDVISLTSDGAMTVKVDNGYCQIAYGYMDDDGELAIAMWDVVIGVGIIPLTSAGNIGKYLWENGYTVYTGYYTMKLDGVGGRVDFNFPHLEKSGYIYPAYCLQHGVDIDSGYYTSNSYLDEVQAKLIGYIIKNGYNPSSAFYRSTFFNDNYKSDIAKWMATQMLIWEVRAGARTVETFGSGYSYTVNRGTSNQVTYDHMTQYTYDNLLKAHDGYGALGPKYGTEFNKQYNAIRSAVENDLKKPSLTTPIVTEGDGKITLTITDSNSVIKNGDTVTVKCGNTSIANTASISGNTLTVEINMTELEDVAPSGTANLTVSVTHTTTGAYYTLFYLLSNSSQNVTFRTDETKPDSVSGSVSVSVNVKPAPIEVPLSIKKEVVVANGDNTVKNQVFTFTVKVKSPADAPHPTSMSGSVTGEGIVDFGKIKFEKEGTYVYTVEENANGKPNGYTYDTERTVTFIVTKGSNNKLTAAATWSGKTNTNVFTNTYSVKSINWTPSVKKEITKPADAADCSKDEFTFTLKLTNASKTGGVKLVNKVINKGEVVGTATVKGASTAKLPTVTFTKEGTYTFTISETKMPAGYKSNTDPKTITVTVTANNRNMLVATPDTNSSIFTFTNTYNYGEVKYAPKVKKTVTTTHDRPVEKTFTFTMTQKSDDEIKVNPASREVQVSVAADKDNATGTFCEITFTKPGTYHFTIAEKNSGSQGYTYSDKTYNVTVLVKDDHANGRLTKEVTVDGVEKNDTFEFTFDNKYTPTPTTWIPAVTKTIDETTGDIDPDPNRMFTFTLSGGKAGEAVLGNETVVSVKNGERDSFSAVTFNKAGTYNFTISETNPNVPGYSQMKSVVATDQVIKVTVTDDNGQLKVTNVSGGILTGTDNSILVEATYKFTNKFDFVDTFWTPSVTKTMDTNGHDIPAGYRKTFTFKMTQTDGASVIAETGETVDVDFVGEQLENGPVSKEASFEKVAFTKPGTYKFTISEERGDTDPTGYTYDKTEYYVTVVVGNVAAKDGNLQKTVTVEKKVGGSTTSVLAESDTVYTFEFTNTYKPVPTEAVLNVKKHIDAAAEQGGYTYPEDTTFRFILEQDMGISLNGLLNGFSLGRVVENQTVTLEASDTKPGVEAGTTEGSVSFAPLKYEKAGTYYYRIREEKGDAAGFTYDNKIWLVTVTVTDKEGSLHPEVTYAYDNTMNQEAAEFTNTYDTEATSYTPQVTKAILGSTTALDKEFTFNLEEVQGRTADKRFTSSMVIDTVTMTLKAGETAGSAGFKTITYEKPGTYEYLIREVKPENAETTYKGYSFDDAIWTLTVKVKDTGNALIVDSAEYEAVGKTTNGLSAEFANEYHVTETKLNAGIKKTVEGDDRPAGQEYKFLFDITQADDQKGATLPDETEITVVIRSDEGSENSGRFGDITFTAAGTYTFEIAEKDNGIPGYTYDTEPFEMTVEVVDNDSQLEVTDVSFTKGGQEVTVEPMTNEIDNTKQFETVFTNVYTVVPVEYAPKVTKEVTGEIRPEHKYFHFTLEAAEDYGDSLTMPEKTTAEVLGTANGSVTTDSFGEITFRKAGTYEFRIEETNDSLPGYTYDKNVWTLTLVVSDHASELKVDSITYATKDTVTNEDITLVGETAAAEFVNDYQVKPTVYGPEVVKTITGMPLWDETFEFELAASADNTEGGAEFSGAESARKVTVTGAGTAKFDDITFKKAGTYTFTVKETAGNSPYWTYDDRSWTLTVVVEDEDSQLVVKSHSYTSNRPAPDTSETAAEFENGFTAPGELRISKTVTGNAGEVRRDFHFTVTLTDLSGNPLKGSYSYTGSSIYGSEDAPADGVITDGVVTVTLRHGQEITFHDIPAGAGYRVEEAEADTDGYRTTLTVDGNGQAAAAAEGTIPIEGTSVVEYENYRYQPTGGTTPDRPGTNIPDNEVPQSPGTPEIITISDEPTPLSNFETIEDEDVPLAFLAPMTGDNRPVGAAALFGLLALGMMGAFGILASKKDEEDA